MGVVMYMHGVGCLGNDRDAWLREQPRQRDLRRGHAGARCERGEPTIAQQPAFVEWRVGHRYHAVAATERQQVPLDASAVEVLDHLIRSSVLAVRQRELLLHIAA